MSGPIRLCTDSSAQLPAHAAAALDVEVVPVSVTLDGKPYDEPELDTDFFYDRLRRGAGATTSQPSPGRFAEAYARAAADGAREVLSIHVAGAVSGTIGAAALAAREAPLPVAVIDTGTVSFGVGLCVLAASHALAAGGSLDEAVAAIERLGPTLRNVFVAAGGPDGRVPARDGLPVLSFRGADTETLGRAESLGDAGALMAARILSLGEPIGVAVGHADRVTAGAADALANALEGSRQVVEVMRYRVGPSVGAHTGPQTFGAFWWPAHAHQGAPGLTLRALSSLDASDVHRASDANHDPV